MVAGMMENSIRKPWSQADIDRLMQLVKKYGTNLKKLSENMEGRS